MKTETHAPGKNKLLSDLSYLVLFLLFTLLPLSVLKPGYPSTQDSFYQYISLENFFRDLKQGQFPVRWTDWMGRNGTHSMPVFSIYQVGFYYFASILKSIIPSFGNTIKAGTLIIWYSGTLFVFLLMKKYGKPVALFSSVLYAFAPYLLLDIFVRGNYPELMAISLIPAILWSADRLVTAGKKVYIPVLSLFLAATVISHLPVLLIFSPLITGFIILLLFGIPNRKPAFFSLVAAAALGIGLSAFYLLPSLAEKPLVHMDLTTSGYYDFHHHFPTVLQLFSRFWGYGPSVEGPNDGMSFQIGIIQVAIFIISALLFAYSYIKKKKVNSTILFWLGTVAYSLFFTLPISLFLWEHLRFLAYLQFPWRFLMVMPLAGAMLGGIVVGGIREENRKHLTIILGGIVVFMLYLGYLHPSAWVKEETINTLWKDSIAPMSDRMYLPKNVSKLVKKDQRYESVSGNPQINPIILLDHRMDYQSQSTSSAILQINTHFFPGWKYYLDEANLPIETEKEFGFMRVQIPSGKHRISLRFENTPIRSISNTITLISLFIVVASSIGCLLKRGKSNLA